MAYTKDLNANSNSNQREDYVMYFNPKVGNWSPRFGTGITQSDIDNSGDLQAIVNAIVGLDGHMIPGKDYEFKGISGSFKSASKMTKAQSGTTFELVTEAS